MYTIKLVCDADLRSLINTHSFIDEVTVEEMLYLFNNNIN